MERWRIPRKDLIMSRKRKQNPTSPIGKWRLVLDGRVPSKKNCLRPSRYGGLHQDPVAKQCIESLVLQASSQWIEEPLVQPTMVVRFFVPDARSDLDNKLVTTIDVLVKAGVLKNDNMNNLSGPITFMGFIDPDSERVEIDMEVMA